MLADGIEPPRSFMRPEIAAFLVQRAKEGRVFFEGFEFGEAPNGASIPVSNGSSKTSSANLEKEFAVHHSALQNQ